MVNEWKSKLLLPGTQVSWLHMTKDGRFLCNACAKYSPDTAVPLSDTGMQATVFTRLGTFRSHATSGKHFKAAAAMANDVQPGAVDTLEAGHLQIVWNDMRKGGCRRITPLAIGTQSGSAAGFWQKPCDETI